MKFLKVWSTVGTTPDRTWKDPDGYLPIYVSVRTIHHIKPSRGPFAEVYCWSAGKDYLDRYYVPGSAEDVVRELAAA